MSFRDDDTFLLRHGHAREHIIALSVAEMAELARAGIKIELCDRVTVAKADPRARSHDLADSIRERWLQSQRAKGQWMDGGLAPQMYAAQHGDKVYVFVYGGNAPPEIIEDDACIYPSDALLARVHLLVNHAK